MMIIFVSFAVSANCWSFARAQKNEVSVSSPNLYFSPYNTYSNGSGNLLANNTHAGSTYALWVNPGAYLKTSFTGTSAALDIEAGQGQDFQPPKVGWSIDGGPLQLLRLQEGSREIQLASHLGTGVHSLWFIYLASDANQDRWNVPTAALKIRGISLDVGQELLPLLSAVGLKSKRILFFGDSITEGAWILGNSNRKVNGRYMDWVAYGDASLAWPRAVAAALDAEYGVCAFGGTSWLTPARPFVPPLSSSWQFYFDGHSRLTQGKLLPRPDYVIVNMGTNDRNRDTTSVIRVWLKEIRNAVGTKTEIIVIVPFGQMNRQSVEAVFANLEDPHTYKIDLGPRLAQGLDHYGHPSLVSFDGLHPKASATAEYAAAIVNKIVKAMNCSHWCVGPSN